MTKRKDVILWYRNKRRWWMSGEDRPTLFGWKAPVSLTESQLWRYHCIYEARRLERYVTSSRDEDRETWGRKLA